MTPFASFTEFSSRTLMGAEAALRTAWSCLHRCHKDQGVPLRAGTFGPGDQPREPEMRERARRILQPVVILSRARLGGWIIDCLPQRGFPAST